MYFIPPKLGGAVGAIATYTADVRGCRETDASSERRACLEYRFGSLEVKEKSSVRVGAELSEENDFSAKLTQEDIAKGSEPIPTSPEPWVPRQRPLS